MAMNISRRSFLKGAAASAAARAFSGGFLATGRGTALVRFSASFPFAGDASFRPAVRHGESRFQGAGRGSSPPRGCLLRVLVPFCLGCGVQGV